MPDQMSADEQRLVRVAAAFRLGGYVTSREAEDWLRLTHGTVSKAVRSGRLWGKREGHRIVVKAQDAERMLRGTP